MSGAMIVATLLRAAEEVTAQVPAASIKIGRLPDGTQPPALLVRAVSSVERQPLKRGGWVRRTDRIAVTVRARKPWLLLDSAYPRPWTTGL